MIYLFTCVCLSLPVGSVLLQGRDHVAFVFLIPAVSTDPEKLVLSNIGRVTNV